MSAGDGVPTPSRRVREQSDRRRDRRTGRNRSARPPSRVRITLSQPVAHHVRSDRNTVVIDFDEPTGRPYVLPAVPAAKHGERQRARRDEGARDCSSLRVRSIQLAALGLTAVRRRALRRRALPRSASRFTTAAASAAAARAGPGGRATASRRQAQIGRPGTTGADPGRAGQAARSSRAIQSASIFRAPICAPCCGASRKSAASTWSSTRE